MSGFTTTPNYSLRKPVVGGDPDQWGGDLNANADTIDTQLKARADAQLTYVPLAGATMSGLLVLSADPAAPLGAATRQYVDNKISGQGPFLPLAGGVMTGLVTLSGAPSSALHPATKAYADQMLPLVGGTMNAPATIAGISNLTFTSADTLAPIGATTILPDVAWGIADKTGGLGLLVDSAGVTWASDLRANAGSITLTADPTTALQASTKQYVDNQRSNSLPLGGGTAAAGTALTVSRADHTHPADPTRAPLIAPTFTPPVTVDTEIWTANWEPDIVWSLRGSAGNIPVWLDYAGVLSVASLVANTFSTPSLSVATLTAGNATLAGEQILDSSPPDLVGIVQGTNGNVVSGYDAVTGEFNVTSLNAATAIKVAGTALGITMPTAPTDAVDVRSAPYNAVGDGVQNHGYVTTAAGLLTITNFTGTVSLSSVDATTTQLDIVGARYSGWAFQARHTGKLLYLDLGGGSTVLARVKFYRSGQSVTLDTTGMTIPIVTSVSGTLTVPAIDTSASVAGKVVIVEGMGQDSYYPPGSSRLLDTVTPYGTHIYYAAVTGFPAPHQIQISPNFPFAWTVKPTRVLWGTNDTAAIMACAYASWPSKRRIWFSGDRLYLLPNLGQDNAGHPFYMANPTGNAGPLVNGMIWSGDNAEAYAATSGGRRLPNRVSPVWAPRYDNVPKMCHGRMSFPRCAQIPANQPINVLFDGDSLSAFNPQGQVQLVMGAMRFIAEFKAQNPGRTINFYNVGVGGATWETINDSRGAYSAISGGPMKYMVIPKPIVGTVSRTAFWQNVNRTATSAIAPIVPDLVVVFCCAGNDKITLNAMAMQSTLNQLRNIPHADSYGPTDIVLQTDHHSSMSVCYTVGVEDGIAPPGWSAATLDEYYNMTLNRTVALNRGHAFIDYSPLQERQAYGFDPTRRGMRQVPQVTLTPAPGAPVGLAENGIDFAFYLVMPTAATDDAGWTALSQLEIQLSQNPGNRLFIRRNPLTGTLWVGASTYGLAVDTVVTVTAGSTAITLGAAQSYTGNVTCTSAWPAVWCNDGTVTFTSSARDKCAVWNTGNLGAGALGRLPQRNYVRTFLDASNMLLHEVTHDAVDVPVTGTWTLGANQFIPLDGSAMSDVVIFYPDGTVFNTQVAYGTTPTATTATLVDAAPQSLAGATVPLFLGRMGLKWFDTGLKPNATTNTGCVTCSVIRGELAMGICDNWPVDLPMDPIMRTLERFGGNYNPVIYTKGTGTQAITLMNRWVDDDVPIAASTPPWFQRGIIETNSSWSAGGTGGHYGASMRPSVFDTLYASQNLSVSS